MWGACSILWSRLWQTVLCKHWGHQTGRQRSCLWKFPRLVEGRTWKWIGAFKCHSSDDKVSVGSSAVAKERCSSNRVAHSLFKRQCQSRSGIKCWCSSPNFWSPWLQGISALEWLNLEQGREADTESGIGRAEFQLWLSFWLHGIGLATRTSRSISCFITKLREELLCPCFRVVGMTRGNI